MKNNIILLLIVTNLVTGFMWYNTNKRFEPYLPLIERIEQSSDALDDFKNDANKWWDTHFGS